jgi:hypothetical protein
VRTITRPELTTGGATISLLALGFPQQAAIGRCEGEHVALGGADDEHSLIGADASRKRLFGFDPPYRLAPVEASQGAVPGRDVHRRRRPPPARSV